MTNLANLLSVEEIVKLAEMKEDIIERLNDVDLILEAERKARKAEKIAAKRARRAADKKFYMESFQVERIDYLRAKVDAIIAEAKARKAAKAAKIEADREYLDAKRREAKSNKRPLSKKARGIVTPLAPQNKNRGKGIAVAVTAKKDNSKALRSLVAINARPVTKASIAVKDLAIAKAQAEVKVATKKAYNALKVSASTSFKAIFSASEIARISAIEIALFEVNDNLHDVLTSYEAICAELEEAKKVLNAEVENFNAVRNAVMKTVSTRNANKKAGRNSAVKEAKVANGTEVYLAAIGDKEVAKRKGKVNNDAIRFAVNVAGRRCGGLKLDLANVIKAKDLEEAMIKAKAIEVLASELPSKPGEKHIVVIDGQTRKGIDLPLLFAEYKKAAKKAVKKDTRKGYQYRKNGEIQLDLQLLASKNFKPSNSKKAKKAARRAERARRGYQYRKNGKIQMNLQLLASNSKSKSKYKYDSNGVDLNVVSPDCNEAHMRANNKDIKEELNSNFFIVDRINVKIDRNSNITEQRFCRSIEGTEQQFAYFNVDMENSSYKAESYDDKGKIKDISIRKTGIKNWPISDEQLPAYAEKFKDGNPIRWEPCKKLDESIMILQVEASSPDRKDILGAKAMGSVFAIKGIYVGEDENGNKKLYYGVGGAEKCFIESHRVVGIYKGYYSSPSTLKHSVVYFAKLNCKASEYYRVEKGTASIEDITNVCKAIDERFDEVDETTQGALSYAIKELELRRINAKRGDKAILPSDYSKIFARPGLLCATPSTKLGKVRNMFLIDADILTEDEFKGANPELKALMADLGIDNNFSDGAFIVTLRLMKKLLKAKAKAKGKDYKYTDEQIMSLGLQLRANLLTLKGFARVYNDNMIYERAVVLLRLYADKITVYCEQSKKFTSKGIKHKYTGKELLKMIDSKDPVKNKLAETIIKNVELMASKNEAKLVNWEKLDEDNAAADLFLIDAQNASYSETSNQMLNKVIHFAPDEIKETLHVMADMDANNITDIHRDKAITMNKDCTGLGSMASDAIKTLMAESAKEDAGIMIKLYASIVSSSLSKIGKARVDTESPYLIAVPDDYMLGSYFDKDGNYVPLNILGVRMHDDYSPRQIANGEKGSRIECIEVYSARQNKKIAKQIADLRKHGKYSKEDLAKIEESLRIHAMLKYPTQGPDEFVFVYFVSNKEIMDRIDEAKEEKKITEKRAKALRNFYFKNPLSCIVIAADNSLKTQLAGFDFDGDAIVTVPRVLSEIDENTHKLVYGIYDELQDDILNDYTSILVAKHVANGNKHICTCIVYDEVERYYNSKPIIGYAHVKRATARAGAEKYESVKNELGSTIFGHNAKAKNPKFTANSFLNKDMVENYVEIKDKLGLYHACNNIGDDIGMTIVLCSVVMMASVSREMFKEDGSFNYDAFSTIFSELKPGRVDGQYDNKPDIHYKSIFDFKDNTKVIATNRFGVKRVYYRVDRKAVSKFCFRVRRLAKDTTKDEWQALVNDFCHITRALGESSIDVKKDVLKTLGKVVYDIIDAGVRCLGNIKKDLINENHRDIFNKDTRENAFTMDFDKMYSKYCCFADGIGDIKEDMAEIYTKGIDSIRRYIVDNTSYNFYKKYEITDPDKLLGNRYSNLRDASRKFIKFSTEASKPGNGIAKLTKYEKDSVIRGLINLAKLDGVDVENDLLMLVRIAIEDAFYSVKDQKFVFEEKYNSKLNSVMNIYNELFVLERTGLKTIPVELKIALDCENELDDSCEGHHFSFTDGVCDTNKNLMVDDNYTGSAKCENGKLIVQYDPTLKYADCGDYLTLSIDAFAKNKGVDISDINFAATGEDIEEGKSYGFNVISNNESELFFNYSDIIDQSGNGYSVLTLEDADGNIVATFDQTLNQEMEASLIGEEFASCMLAGNTYVVKSKQADSKYKTEKKYYSYILNGVTNF